MGTAPEPTTERHRQPDRGRAEIRRSAWRSAQSRSGRGSRRAGRSARCWRWA